jgi:hypothetical protein
MHFIAVISGGRGRLETGVKPEKMVTGVKTKYF